MVLLTDAVPAFAKPRTMVPCAPTWTSLPPPTLCTRGEFYFRVRYLEAIGT
jgi:hypothetical protein